MKIAYLLIFLLCASTLVAQTTIVLQPGPETGKDALVSSRHEVQNIGYTTEFIAAAWTFTGEVGIYRSLLEFDLTAIPQNAQILEAKLSLYHNATSPSNGHAGNNTSYLRRITAPWDEQTVTWNSQPTATDIDQVVLLQSTNEEQDYENIDVTTLLQGMHQDPAHNFGFQLILSEESIYRSMKFNTSDSEESTLRPKLEITYTTTNTCVTFQPGAEGKDAVAWSIMPETNIANSAEFIASTWTFSGETGHYRSFLQFDLTAVPSSAQLVSANLSLYHNNTSTSDGHEGSNSASLRRITSPWEEQSINWNNQPSTSEVNEIILPVSSNESEDYEDFDLLPLVTDWVANPADNYGFMMKQVTEQIYRSLKFSSGDYEDPGRHPKLDVCYTTIVSNKDLEFKEVEILPNPFEQSFIIRNLEGPYTIQISDINGRIVYQRNLVSERSGLVVDEMHDLPAGMYFVRASGSEEYYGKVVKQ